MMRMLMVILIMAAVLVSSAYAQPLLEGTANQQAVITNLSAGPLAFTENRGQWNQKVLFRAEAGGATFFFCNDKVAYLFVRDTDELLEDDFFPGHDISSMPDKFNRPRYKKEAMLIEAQFVEANPNPEIIMGDRLLHNCNYFYGNNPAKWRTDVPNYSAITYKDIWPGIDLRYHGNGQGMKYDFIVNPGADISQIRICYKGVDNLSVSSSGNLQAQTRFGLAYENIPEIYQDINGVKLSVSGRYRLIEPAVFGFTVAEYDPSFALLIDPTLFYSTYLGGSGDDYGYGIAVDGSGSAYVTGRTFSDDFPVVNPYDGSYNGNEDVFVTKLSPEGNALTYSTYLGGSDDDLGDKIAIDYLGSAYVTGYTSSDNFPMVNPYDGGYHGNKDVFVTKLSPEGNALAYSTYLGGGNEDDAHGIAVDGAGSAYVTGGTYSGDFPTTVNAYDRDLNGGGDAFVTKLSPAGNALAYSSYLGGGNIEGALAIAVDGAGSAYVTGWTFSGNFPTTVNAYDRNLSGEHDIFVTKLSPEGNDLTYSTYLGGGSDDDGWAIATGGSGGACVTGVTNSGNFPTVNPYDGDFNGGECDAFVTALSPAGNALTYSTYLGGNSGDCGYGIAVDGLGSVYVSGYTYSDNFPTADPFDGTYNGDCDAFVAKFGPQLVQIPTLSEWGVFIFGLMLLAMGTTALIRRRRVVMTQ